MEKKQVIECLMEYLDQEIEGISQDAGAQSQDGIKQKLHDLNHQKTVYRFLPTRHYDEKDPIIPSSLSCLELNGRRAFYFLVPSGGGLVTSVNGVAIQVITPHSPLGEALLGKKKGEEFEVDMNGKPRKYKVIECY